MNNKQSGHTILVNNKMITFNLSVSSHVAIFTIFLHLTGFCYSKLEQCKGQDGKKFKKLIIDD